MLDNDTVLIFNIILYVSTLIIYQYYKKVFDLGSFILLLYAFISITAMDLFNSPLSNFNNLKIFPFVYLYFGLMSMFWPILRFREEKILYLVVHDSPLLKLVSLVIILTTCTALFVKINSMPLSSLLDYSTLLHKYESIHDGLESMTTKTSYSIIFYYIIKEFTIPLLIYNIIVKNKQLIFCLSICVVFDIAISLADGSRRGLIVLIMSIPFIYLVCGKIISPKIRKKLTISIAVFLSVILIGFSAVTLARFGQNKGDGILLHSLKNYTSQSFLVFNNFGLDANGIRYGDRTAPIVRMAVGLKTSTNYYERRFTYWNMLVNDSYFSTFVGDFTLDYGPEIGMIIILIFSFVFGSILKQRNDYYAFSQIFILYVLYRWCASGFTLWPYAEKIGNIQLFLIFLVYVLVRREEKRILK